MNFTCGKYKLVRRLGAGGIAEVWEAVDRNLKRKVAIKLLQPAMSRRETIVRRFQQEAEAVARLDHKGIVRIYNTDIASDGRAYMALEYLRGESLAERLQRRGQMPIERALQLIRELAEAMMAVHDMGILHRDLKPDNLFLEKDESAPGGERLKVLDFGIAKLVSETDDCNELTSNGSILGTPAYMAPEQCQNSREIGAPADLYSIGCVMYHCLCGRPPFEYDNPVALIGAQLQDLPVPPQEWRSDLPTDVAAIIVGLLQKSPRERIGTCRALIDELDRLGPPDSLDDSDSGAVTTMQMGFSNDDDIEAPDVTTMKIRPERCRLPRHSDVARSAGDGSDAAPMVIAADSLQDTERIVASHLFASQWLEEPPRANATVDLTPRAFQAARAPVPFADPSLLATPSRRRPTTGGPLHGRHSSDPGIGIAARASSVIGAPGSPAQVFQPTGRHLPTAHGYIAVGTGPYGVTQPDRAGTSGEYLCDPGVASGPVAITGGAYPQLPEHQYRMDTNGVVAAPSSFGGFAADANGSPVPYGIGRGHSVYDTGTVRRRVVLASASALVTLVAGLVAWLGL